jgi:hypothetical protein
MVGMMDEMANPHLTDAQMLADRFSISELREELHRADVNVLPDFDDYSFWLWYKDVVELAIDLKKAKQPLPIHKPGYIDVESLKQRTDIVAVVEVYGVRLKKAGHNFKALCPFHKEKTPSFIVYPEKKTWHCFGACNTGGDVFGFVMKFDNIGFVEAAAKIGDLS